MTADTNIQHHLFRANALKHLQASDAITKELMIVKPKAWMWVSASCLLLLSLGLWIMLGQVAIYINGSGIILPENGQMIPIQATQSGTVSHIYMKPGTEVKQGELIADIDNPFLDQDLVYLQQLVETNEKQFAIFKNSYQTERNNLIKDYQQKRKSITDNIKDNHDMEFAMNKLYNSKLALYKKHYLTIIDLNKGKADYITAKQQAAAAMSEANEIDRQFKESLDALDEKMNQYELKYSADKHALDNKLLEKNHGTHITSPANGILTGSNIAVGDYITNGKSLFSIISHNDTHAMETLVFVSHHQGKKIQPGMPALVLPTILSAYDYGYIKGSVISISEYPISKEAAYSYLGNMNLVDDFFTGGSPFIARVKLPYNPNTISHLAWSTKHGTPFEIKPGTTVTANINYTNCTPLQLLTTCRHS